MMRDSAAIIAAMVPITRLEHCPKRVKQYVVDACAVYVRGFIESVCNPDLGEGHYFKDGWIWYLSHNTGSDSYQHIDNFEEDLEKLAREYWEPAEQADPAEAQIPALSSSRSRISPSTPSKLTFTIPGA